MITFHQVRVDGVAPSARHPFPADASFYWFGAALRLDGARAAMLLDDAEGLAELRRRVPRTIAKLSRSRGGAARPAHSIAPEPDPDALILTDGQRRWQGRVLRSDHADGLILFADGLPPAGKPLRIVQGAILPVAPDPRATICFTPGTQIATPTGSAPVEDLYPGDSVLTRDDGPQRILWMGLRRVSGARLFAMPDLRPIRIRAEALGKGAPQPDLIVSPDHRILLDNSQSRALWGENEVLVRARDLLDDRRVTVDHAATDATYIHILFAKHQVVEANGVPVESFHPGDADLTHLGPADMGDLLDVAPAADSDPSAYGPHARRCLTRAELAILQHEGAPAYLA